MSRLDDRDLMRQVAKGSDQALAELHDRYVTVATRVVQSICRDPARAEDALQETFVSVWRGAATYRPERGVVSAWLLQIARNRAIDAARRDRVHDERRTDAEHLVTRPAPDDVVAEACRRVDSAQVVALLADLPLRQREVLTLAYFGELTHEEIALRLCLPAGTVKGRIRAGLRALRPAAAETVTWAA